MENKKSKKPLINFNEFWPALKTEAVRKRLKKVEWLTKSGIHYQRYSEFDADPGAPNKRDISARYFLRLIGGLNLKTEDTEKALGRKFSEAQRQALRFEALVDANREWLEVLLADPETVKICKSVVAAKSKA